MRYPYYIYFIAQTVGAVIFALLLVIGLTIYALIPLFNKQRDKAINARRIIRSVFSYVKIKKVDENTKNNNGGDKHVTKVFEYQIQEWYIGWICALLYAVVISTALIFWSNFFIEHSSSCNPYDDFDCFPNERVIDIFFETPFNCSKGKHDNVQCLKFSCNLGNAVGLATGTFAFSWFTATVLLWIIIQCTKPVLKDVTDQQNVNTWCKHCCIKDCPDCGNIKCCMCGRICCVAVIVCFQIGVLTFAIAIIGSCSYLLSKGQISVTCYYETFIFSVLIIVPSTTMWYCTFKQKRLKAMNSNNSTPVNLELEEATPSTGNSTESNTNTAQNNNTGESSITGPNTEEPIIPGSTTGPISPGSIIEPISPGSIIGPISPGSVTGPISPGTITEHTTE